MSMIVVLVKLAPDLRRAVVDSGGALLNDLLDRRTVVDGFARETDVFSGLDYRDLKELALDDGDPLLAFFDGTPLVDGYAWTYGPPAWFDSAATRQLRDALADDADFWPQSDIVEFLDRALAEGKGLVAGVA